MSSRRTSSTGRSDSVLNELSAGEARDFLTRRAGSYLADRLRSDWLKALGRRAEWQTFDSRACAAGAGRSRDPLLRMAVADSRATMTPCTRKQGDVARAEGAARGLHHACREADQRWTVARKRHVAARACSFR
jgi:hypothetical protein